jgi:hypothetical protein
MAVTAIPELGTKNVKKIIGHGPKSGELSIDLAQQTAVR